MTFKEYTDAMGFPTPILPNPATAAFNKLMLLRYGEDTCFTDDKALFKDKIELYYHLAGEKYTRLISNINKLVANTVDDAVKESATTTGQTDNKTAPYGTLSTAGNSLDGVVSKGTLERTVRGGHRNMGEIIQYQNEIDDMFKKLLDEFQPLFVGVY